MPLRRHTPLPTPRSTTVDEIAIPKNIIDLATVHALANTPLDQVICGAWNARVTVGDLRTLIDEIGPSAATRRASRARVTAPPEDDGVA